MTMNWITKKRWINITRTVRQKTGSEAFISEYATMHPYEDWAETWAHYMHIMDTLETAQNFSITGSTSDNSVDAEEVEDLKLPQGAYLFFCANIDYQYFRYLDRFCRDPQFIKSQHGTE